MTSRTSPDIVPLVNRGRHLATGGQAQIFLSRRRSDLVTVVEKVSLVERRESDESNRRLRVGEIEDTSLEVLRDIHSRLRGDELIVQILIFPSLGQPIMHLEFCEGGDLHKLVADCVNGGHVVPESFLWHVYKSLAAALLKLHTGARAPRSGYFMRPRSDSTMWQPILHRDLKPDNVLLARDPANPAGFPLVKLGDFDFATFYDPEDRVYYGGLASWMPPEQYVPPTEHHATPAGDVFSVGAIIHFMGTGRSPKIDLHPAFESWELQMNNTSERTGAARVLPDYYSHLLEDCMRMTVCQVEDRVTAPELFQRVWPAAEDFIRRVGEQMPSSFQWIAPLRNDEIIDEEIVEEDILW